MVMLGTNRTLPPPIRLELAATFCRVTSAMEGVEGVVRLHPSERVADYASIASSFPSVRFVHNDQVSLSESLAIADLTACHSSGFADDSVLHGIPCVLLHLPATEGVGPVDVGLGPDGLVARSESELRDTILRFLTDAAFRSHWQQATAEAGHRIVAYRGRDAAERTAHALLELAGITPSSGEGPAQDSV